MPAASIRPLHPVPRSLSQLCARFGLDAPDDIDHLEVTGVSISSKDVDAGDLYVGIPGARVHGASFADDARADGAVAVLTDAAGAALAADSGLPVLVTEDPRAALGEVSAWIYRTDPDVPKLFGVTGTNGKTTVAYILDGLLGQLGVLTGLTTTVERRIGDERIDASLTTPEANELHALIARMREVGVHAASIEVSAQAITRHRVDGLLFDVVGFTNLSHDHLDDYPDFASYFEAKLELFTPERARRGVVSLDSEWGAKLVENTRIPVTTITSKDGVEADWRVIVGGQRGASTTFTLVAPDGRSLDTSIPMPGWFSAANAGLAIVMLVESGYDLDQIGEALERDGGVDAFVPGRLELVSGERGPRLYVDYGHTPDAFEQTLGALREFTTGRLFMIFGADGDRDATKRPDMARIAAELADVVIITDYNPRTEDPEAIRRVLVDAARAARPEGEVLEIADARLGIRRAVELADDGDTILVAGPGHESYTEVAGEKIHYSARDEAREALREAGWQA
ncbi:UDP-N-acetylmuramoyl-L-alanyl-D-glutamate--2,6-diaminopimelate ligase [Pseudoclavibacter chungangensis]|uniref:UDP-N-acetylmuramyl-tripeptide synthetase n=1 Tax=Pseudoclavibacter chungangensis TaxID=587635 RepID=A0A7J5C060_9MICO|nr:UDP-N-acetylmuramoyl-L-alanyl-D-glutamate--2,6-diaminopimelate ligase [Pseudoclavibacter chungangensis]KAB1660104.1 UDP-N-acetylmuramoyl-L-alanyl-D-glutamate--2,6-diaminopimelate ligase [Pseudoclavibacter chungangensis]NYJ66792.1 UDP-N-acetylmuramoyl-L-alanyl-D-glutamate--2,6-diaminopimelate ligase [Pseudoclavibacter chungangensis]